jgi:predicted RNA binding protein YcfA (HicA-like mRNA interferase family)
MPRKIRQLLADLRRAGFEQLPRRGKGSHTVWSHPLAREVQPTIAGQEGDDAKPYQEREVRAALAAVEAVTQAVESE